MHHLYRLRKCGRFFFFWFLCFFYSGAVIGQPGESLSVNKETQAQQQEFSNKALDAFLDEIDNLHGFRNTVSLILAIHKILACEQFPPEQLKKVKAGGQELVRKLLVLSSDNRYQLALLLNKLSIADFDALKKAGQELLENPSGGSGVSSEAEKNNKILQMILYLEAIVPLQIITQDALNFVLKKYSSTVSVDNISIKFPTTIDDSTMLDYFTNMKTALALIKDRQEKTASNTIKKREQLEFTQAEEKLQVLITLLSKKKAAYGDTTRSQISQELMLLGEKSKNTLHNQLYALAKTFATEEDPALIKSTLSQLLSYLPEAQTEKNEQLNQDNFKTTTDKIKDQLENLKATGKITAQLAEKLLATIQKTGSIGLTTTKITSEALRLIFPLIIGGALMMASYGIVYTFFQHACLQLLMMIGMQGVNSAQLGYLALNGVNLLLNTATLDYFPLLTKAKSWQGALDLYNKSHAAELFYSLKGLIGLTGLLGSIALEFILSCYLYPVMNHLMIAFNVDPNGKVALLLRHGMKFGIMMALAVFSQADITVNPDDSYQILSATDQLKSIYTWTRSSLGYSLT